jgi:hypothetical protein
MIIDTIPRIDEINREGILRWQKQVYELIKQIKPQIVVETGVGQPGVSSAWILRALEENGSGFLFSIEAITPQPFEHPQWTFYQGKSIDILPEIFNKTGWFDVFIHDSDHEVLCTTFEYEFGYQCTKVGGYIMSDDCGWGCPPHWSWQKFLKRHDLKNDFMLGGCAVVQKTSSELLKQDAFSYSVELANAATAEYDEIVKKAENEANNCSS